MFAPSKEITAKRKALTIVAEPPLEGETVNRDPCAVLAVSAAVSKTEAAKMAIEQPAKADSLGEVPSTKVLVVRNSAL